MFGITQESRATIHMIGENPDYRAGRVYRLNPDEFQELNTRMRGGVGVVELHRAPVGPTQIADLINVAAIAYLERHTVSIADNARVELHADGDGPDVRLYLVDPDDPMVAYEITNNGADRRFADRGFKNEAMALLEGDLTWDDEQYNDTERGDPAPMFVRTGRRRGDMLRLIANYSAGSSRIIWEDDDPDVRPWAAIAYVAGNLNVAPAAQRS
jgi:hypothetical protein